MAAVAESASGVSAIQSGVCGEGGVMAQANFIRR
jgi:hypothetical protein